MSFLHNDRTQVVEIASQVRQERIYFTYSISWVLVSWRLKEGQGISNHDIYYDEPNDSPPYVKG